MRQQLQLRHIVSVWVSRCECVSYWSASAHVCLAIVAMTNNCLDLSRNSDHNRIGLIPDLNVYLRITQLACTSQRDNTNAWKRAPGFDPIYDIEHAMKFSISLLLIKKAEDNARRLSINWCYTITILKFWLMSVINYNLVLPSMTNVLFLQRFYMNNRSSVLISQPSNLNWFFYSEVQQGCYKQARGVRTELFFFFFLW